MGVMRSKCFCSGYQPTPHISYDKGQRPGDYSENNRTKYNIDMTRKERKYYNRIKKGMVAAGIYTDINDSVIEHAAITLSLVDDAKAAVEKSGQIQTFKTGAKQIAPEVNNLRGLMSDFLKYADKLGLTPGALQKLGGETKEEPIEAKFSIMSLAKKPNVSLG